MTKELEAHETGMPFVEGGSPEESSAESSSAVEAHTISVTVCAAPSAVVCGEAFSIKVGVQCSAGCNVTGQDIEIYDHKGERMAMATLGQVAAMATIERPFVGVTLQAPSAEGRYRWAVKFPESNLEIPHGEALSTFAFAVAPKADHLVTVEALEKDTRNPVSNARVVLRPHVYRGSKYGSRTDDAGMAKIRVPKGRYQLYVASDQYEILVPTIQVNGDLTIATELSDPINSWKVRPW